jgi:hypothetical protein
MTRTRTLLILLTFCLAFVTAPFFYVWAMDSTAPEPALPPAAPQLALSEAASPAEAPATAPAAKAEMVKPADLPALDDAPATVVRPAVHEPTIWLTPDAGGADVEVTVEGAGFPADLLLAVYVGLPNAGYGPANYVTFVSDATGAFRVSFALPATWPDGRRITQPRLIVITSTEDGRVKALAPLTYVVVLEGRGGLAAPAE